MKKYTLQELKPFLIGHGTERACYHSPENPAFVIKLSPKHFSKQTRRELKYFKFLQKKGVPFTHLPQYKGEVHVEGYIGFEQGAIVNTDGSLSQTLEQYFQTHAKDSVDLDKLLAELYQYMYRYNIVPCDLNKTNVLIQFTPNGPKLVLVDGIGNTDFIALAQYWKYWGRKKIERKWPRFLKKEVYPLLK